MLIEVDKLWIYRIIPIQNLEHNLKMGLNCKSQGIISKDYVTIGSSEIIGQRDRTKVKIFPGTFVNDYVPFYFSVRTPMLYNIITGHGVPSFPQKDIIYLCCRLSDLATDDFQWCYTDGNAAKAITKFFRKLDNIESKIDWRSIHTTDFRDDNADGDEDRIRKKHAEFLIHKKVSSNLIKAIVVLNSEKKEQVEKILAKLDLKIKVVINPDHKYYFI